MPKRVTVELAAGERRTGESGSAVVACNDWLRLGPGRKLTTLAQRYMETPENPPPTRSLQTLRTWSKKYVWQDRAAEFDAAEERIKDATRQRVLAEGLALDYERVTRLVRLAEDLEGQIYEELNGLRARLWLPDVKQIGSGEFAERVDIVRFNAALIEQFRGTLDDIAKETGGRVKKSEITGRDGGPLEMRHVDDLSDDELAVIAAGGGGGTAETP